MTLDEAIKHAEEVAEENNKRAECIRDKMKSEIALSNATECETCADEHRQLAEWLKDYKRLLEQQPSDETIKYLECNDIDVQKFTEAMKKQRLQVIKPNICDDCISRQAVIDMTGLSNWFESSDDYNSFVEDLCKLPPVTPTQCIAAVRFSKDDLREICNERIEIECTHGTCKDCKHRDPEDKKCDCGHAIAWQMPRPDNWYCADFEKRGNEE